MTCYKLVWTGAKPQLETAGDAFEELLFPAPGAVSLTKDDPALSDDKAAWRLEAYFDAMPDMDAVTALTAEHGGLTEPAVEELPDIDWVAHALEGLGVVRCGRFVLYGAHDSDKLPNEDGDIPIRIDANQAFGTGHHPTTAGCLTLLDRFAGMAPKKVLDLGCGSAVLAIAAAKLWTRMALATDIDPTSVDIAAENVALNDVEDFVVTQTAEGFDHPDIAEAAPFDLIFANILKGPLLALAKDLTGALAPGGHAILSGILVEQAEDVLAEYLKYDAQLQRQEDIGDWTTIILRKIP